MTAVTLTGHELVMASTIGVRRRVDSMRKGFGERNGAARKDVALQWWWNIVGACGELAVAKLVGQYWHAGIGQAKNEPDVGATIQVRTLAAAHYDLIVRDDDPDRFQYVLVTGEPPTFIVHGWTWGRDARDPGWRRDRGERGQPCYWVPQAALRPLSELVADAQR